MATVSVNPNNKSFLSNNKYQLVVARLPNVQFFTQSITLPNISLSNVRVQNPYTSLPVPGNQITYDPLTVNYAVDEDMQAWFEIYDWMTNLGNPESLDKLGSLTKTPGKNNSVTSDATLLVKTNANNINIKFHFFDLFPTDLSGVTFTSTEGHDFLYSSITFAYSHFKAEKI